MNPFESPRMPDVVPRYLWRAWSKNSAGTNSSVIFNSNRETNREKHCRMPEGTHLDEMSQAEAKTALQGHILQWSGPATDNLISFSSSLLWVLQHAIRKAYHDDGGIFPGTVQICLLDTTKLPHKTFDSTVSFLRHYELRDDYKLLHAYHEAEYLAHGQVDISRAGSTVDLSTLVANGLFDLFPAYDDEGYRKQLVIAVSHLRQLWQYSGPERPVTNEDLSSARQLARCFDPSLQHAAFISVMSMHRRSDDGQHHIARFPTREPHGTVAYMSGVSKLYNPFWRDGGIAIFSRPEVPLSLPEVRQCCDIMAMIDHETVIRSENDTKPDMPINGLRLSLEGLSISAEES